MMNNLFLCPGCKKGVLREIEDGYVCKNKNCFHSTPENSYLIHNGIPVLFSEDLCDTICQKSKFSDQKAEIYVGRAGTIKTLLKKTRISSGITQRNVRQFILQVKKAKKFPKILIIGSGEKGNAIEAILNDDDIMVVGVDIYYSPTVDVIADAHYLPFKDSIFDGVLIQAVLEHVVEPSKVVGEIHRTLRKFGIVYAETPFMQQVHEGAYDFTRFTVSGHRYLFRDFDSIDIGVTEGATRSLSWSVKYFWWGVFRSKAVGTVLAYPLTIFASVIDRFLDDRVSWDACSGVYFLGKRSENRLNHKDLVQCYLGKQ